MADVATSPPPDEVGWRSRSGFVLATVGSAVGIGSIWKFPYEVGANGGGAFVVVYVAGLALVVVPLMLAEFALGRRGRADAATSIEAVARAEGRSPRWAVVGVLGATTAFLILSFYAVIGGWTLAYTVDVLRKGLPSGSVAVTDRFDHFLGSPARMVLFQALFLAAVALVVNRGVQRGIERSMRVLMPLLAVLLVALAGYSMSTGDAGEALRFLFVPTIDDLDGRAVLDALGLGFFSIGVGLGILLTYAAYSPPAVGLRSAAVVSVATDTAISLLAGLAVFPVVFANGIDPGSGPGLAFVSLPLAFDAMPGGRWAAATFFAMLAIAALGSAISMLEAVVAVVGRRVGWGRRRAVVAAACVCFVVGLASVLSFNRWADVHPLAMVGRYVDATIFDLLDEVTSRLLLPLGGLVLAVFCAWVLPARVLGAELDLGGWPLVGLRLALRFVAPGVIVAATVAFLIG
ncbi:MAG: sodium-dependent transporter [Microthrixaceae bacterium]|nr:sodium-dependent transporter [Microthrixaceae bacterium]